MSEVVHESNYDSLLDSFNPLKNRLNWLLLAVPVALFFYLQDNHPEMIFLFSMISIMPLAFLMGHATEEIALRAGENLGGLLNATFGNAVEIIIASLAIYTAFKHPDQAETMIVLVQASLIGSILGNLLLVLGLALLWGGIKFKIQSFNQSALSMNGSLLLLAVLALIIPAAAHHTGSNVTDENVLELSRYASLALLAMYGLSLFFQFKTHSDIFNSSEDSSHHEEPKMSIKNAWTLLIIATIMVGIMAELLVKSVDDAASEWGMPTLFIGVILLPFFGNAAEHFTAVIVAGKDKMDLSLAIAIGSSVQIAVFVAPLMVLFAWIMGVSLSLEFGLLETAATFMGVLVANFILNDGKTNWLEGAMLLACYVILALSFFLIPFEVGA